MPLYKLKLEELAANQEGSKSLVTATNTRRKQQQEMVAMALVAEECKKREAREAFPLSSVAVNVQAAQEFTKVNQLESDETSDEAQEAVLAREVVTAHSVFPTCVCLVGLAMFDLLEDSESCNGTTVGCTVESVIKACMVEDASLFFRYLFEKLTDPSRRSDMFKVLRKLVVSIPNLPSNAAYILFNNLVGYVLFYHRTANITASICINQAMSVIWQLVPSVQGLNFKDLKTMLKKVQSEQTLMITAHLTSAKKIIVHGIDGALPPQQFVVHEDTQFKVILQESLEYFSITEEIDHYQLADAKTSRMRCGHCYVRDFYVFRRNNTPQLKLVKLPPADASAILQKQAMSIKFTELCKVELAKNILKFTNHAHMENQVLFLHEEFNKQAAFPRKALETEFSYFVSGLGDEMQGIDVTHKMCWVQFLNTLFKSMPGTFGWTNELKLFLNVINGCLILNCADHGMLRMCMAIYLNLANHFKQVFSTEGFLLIMPTMIKVFNTHLNYPTVRSALIFLHAQFFKLHRRPYLLQFLGSYEPFISFAETKEDKQALSKQLFNLLHSLEKQEEDVLGILHLVWGNEPIRTLDFCYDENEEYKVLDAINTIITVVAYQTESHRSTQMLVVLEAIMPWYMQSLLTQAQQNPFHDAVQTATDEVSLYFKLSQSIRALIIGSEALMKPMAAHRSLEAVTSLSGHKKDAEDSVFSARVEEGRYDHEQELETRNRSKEFRRPRDALLSIVSEFFSTCLVRLELEKKHIERLKITPSYYLDSKSHERLAEVAHSLLRAGTYDPETMSCRGLQRYMQEILPEGDWLQETMKPSINTITKRLERIFSKVQKKTLNRTQTDWDALATLLRGVCLTLETRPSLHHLPHIKSLVNACTNIVLEYGPGPEASCPEKSNLLPNHIFCTMVAKLAALHAAVLGETGGIEQMAYGPVPSREKVEMILANFVVPLCLRIGGNDKEKHVLPQTDIRFILCLILSSLIPHSKYVDMLKPMPREPVQFGGQPHHSVNYGHHQPTHLLQKLAFLGMKAMLVCCEGQLLNLLTPLVQALIEVAQRCAGVEMWQFFDFTVSVRTIVYPLIKPYLQGVLLAKTPDTEEEALLLHSIRDKIYSAPTHLNKTHLLASFADELSKLRVHLSQTLGSGEITRTHSISANTGVRRRFSTWRKNSLISRIHQSDNNTQVSDRSQSMAHVTPAKADHIVSATSLTASPATSHAIADELFLVSKDNLVTDEIAPLAPKLSRNSTRKGSRRGSSVPLKRISASDGANLLLEKFGALNNSPPHLSRNKKYYERLVHTGRKAHALQLVKQPNVIIEEETTLSCSTADHTNVQQACSSLVTESTEMGNRAKGKPQAPNVTQSDGDSAAINSAEIHITIPSSDGDDPLLPSNLLSPPAPHGLHRHGGLYQHPHEHNGGQSQGSLAGYGVSASIDSTLSAENITPNIAAALKRRSMNTEDISHCEGKQLRKIPVIPADSDLVTIDITRNDSVASSSSGLANKMLRRKGTDTDVLVQNEQPLATNETVNKFGGIMNPMSENTTFSSRRNSRLPENIPYMDHTSSSDDEQL
ncbi:protein unc-80 homolog isoform X2 [Watersipora subatra]|uniref:protein unc-80 homolog isoform X2 n=1 Tax=Watersipora subatra TaxID=2589382 RepID=UPI00355C57B2